MPPPPRPVIDRRRYDLDEYLAVDDLDELEAEYQSDKRKATQSTGGNRLWSRFADVIPRLQEGFEGPPAGNIRGSHAAIPRVLG